MRAFAPAAALRRPVVANLRRGWPQPPDAPIPEGLWSLRLLESYPYKLARRANPPPQRRKPKPPPPLEVTREAADAAAEKLKDGANGFIAKGKNRLHSGSHYEAIRFAMYALTTTMAESSPTLRTRAHELLQLVQQAVLLSDWRAAISEAAAEEHAADLLETGGDGTGRHARGKASSTPKPRQGWSKAQMRDLHARICCACRIIRPGPLLWRVMHLKRPAEPGEVIKPRRLRRVRRRSVWLPEVRVPGTPTAAEAPAIDARLAAMPAGSLAEKKAKLQAKRQAEAAASRGRVLIQRLPGGASEALQGDDALWSPPVRGVRSVYVCRNAACVRSVIKLKLFNKGLRGPVRTQVAEALLAATELEAAADAARPADVPPPGVSAEFAARIAALEPRVPPRPTEELRGPHDNWLAPPAGPRRA